MSRIFDLIKRTFDIWAKERWLRRIDKEVNKYNRMNDKTRRQAYAVRTLVDKYNELCPDIENQVILFEPWR